MAGETVNGYEGFRKETARQLAEEERLIRLSVTRLEPFYKSLPNKTLSDRIKRAAMHILSPI